MFIFIFVILLTAIMWKLIMWSIRAAWGITKILLSIILMPAILIMMVCAGFVYLAIPILIIVGIVVLIGAAKC